MIAELLARTGRTVIGDIPPDGRDYWAARYWDRDTHEQHPLLRADFLKQKETIARYLADYAGDVKEITEIACGTGEFTRLAAELTPAERITAVDISVEGLKRTKERVKHPNLRLIHGDFWKDQGIAQTEVVMCLDAIHHLGDVKQVLTRLRSFVKPGGTFIGNLWTLDNFHEFQRQRYGKAEHLRRTAGYLGTALIVRASGGRLKTGAYRTQLITNKEALAILNEVFDEVVEFTVEPYFTGFVCKVGDN
jgi:ubiquinone/menaquinone biosynthesis C-methylase UbiE